MKKMLFALPALMIAVPATAQVMAPTEYVITAGASDLYEITSSSTVLETTTDPKVRQFAQMMIAHHSKSTADLKAAASFRLNRAYPADRGRPFWARVRSWDFASLVRLRRAEYLDRARAAAGWDARPPFWADPTGGVES